MFSHQEPTASYKPGGYHQVSVGDSLKYGRYLVLKKIGWGQFATVWLCWDRLFKSHVAIKIVKSAPKYSITAIDEILLLKVIKSQVENEHCPVVQILDYFSHRGENGIHICIVLEYLGPNTLTLIQYHKERGIPLTIVKPIAKSVLKGAQYLHSKCNIIHTDLKPENVLFYNPMYNTSSYYHQILSEVSSENEIQFDPVSTKFEMESYLSAFQRYCRHELGLPDDDSDDCDGKSSKSPSSSDIALSDESSSESDYETDTSDPEYISFSQQQDIPESIIQPADWELFADNDFWIDLIDETGNSVSPPPGVIDPEIKAHLNFGVLLDESEMLDDSNSNSKPPYAFHKKYRKRRKYVLSPEKNILKKQAKKRARIHRKKYIKLYDRIVAERNIWSKDFEKIQKIHALLKDRPCPQLPSNIGSTALPFHPLPPPPPPKKFSGIPKRFKRGPDGQYKILQNIINEHQMLRDASFSSIDEKNSLQKILKNKIEHFYKYPGHLSKHPVYKMLLNRRKQLSHRNLNAPEDHNSYQYVKESLEPSVTSTSSSLEETATSESFDQIPPLDSACSLDTNHSVPSESFGSWSSNGYSSVDAFPMHELKYSPYEPIDIYPAFVQNSQVFSLEDFGLLGAGDSSSFSPFFENENSIKTESPATPLISSAMNRFFDVNKDSKPPPNILDDAVSEVLEMTLPTNDHSESPNNSISLPKQSKPIRTQTSHKISFDKSSLDTIDDPKSGLSGHSYSFGDLNSLSSSLKPAQNIPSQSSQISTPTPGSPSQKSSTSISSLETSESCNKTLIDSKQTDSLPSGSSSNQVQKPRKVVILSPPAQHPSPKPIEKLSEQAKSHLMIYGICEKPQIVQITPQSLSKPNNVHCKIVDLGNSCYTNYHFTWDIQTRQYRAPEVILGYDYDEQADIWSIACLIFELVTGDWLFDSAPGDTWTREEDHIAQMIELLGHLPKYITTRGNYARQFFNSAGQLKNIKNLKYYGLVDFLHQKYRLSAKNSFQLSSFLLPMLEYDPCNRSTAWQSLQHEWLVSIPLPSSAPGSQPKFPPLGGYPTTPKSASTNSTNSLSLFLPLEDQDSINVATSALDPPISKDPFLDQLKFSGKPQIVQSLSSDNLYYDSTSGIIFHESSDDDDPIPKKPKFYATDVLQPINDLNQESGNGFKSHYSTSSSLDVKALLRDDSGESNNSGDDDDPVKILHDFCQIVFTEDVNDSSTHLQKESAKLALDKSNVQTAISSFSRMEDASSPNFDHRSYSNSSSTGFFSRNDVALVAPPNSEKMLDRIIHSQESSNSSTASSTPTMLSPFRTPHESPRFPN